MIIEPFYRTALYYETDKMGIVHHSNYIRWLEEARIDFLKQIGLPYDEMEKNGIMIPVLSVSCQYKYAVRFDETVCIKMKLEDFSGLKFKISYNVTDKKTGDIRIKAESSHFFVDGNFKPIRVKNVNPKIYDTFNSIVGIELYE
ncbi:MAG: acyl-CoA thioesterase [Firmicutes bacterium]|nr:acyl-CoA thioesterase [[Eubacterium] siraeum]MCM1487092.1 acyl-CoA thioesterase [Bacillota bacterium]